MISSFSIHSLQFSSFIYQHNPISQFSGCSRAERRSLIEELFTERKLEVNFRSLLNTNSMEKSEMTIETTRIISEEISNKKSRKLKEIRSSLKSQKKCNYHGKSRESASFHPNYTDVQGRSKITVEDRSSSGFQRNPGSSNAQKTRENHPKSGFAREKQQQVSRQCSVDSYTSEQSRDRRVQNAGCPLRFGS